MIYGSALTRYVMRLSARKPRARDGASHLIENRILYRYQFLPANWHLTPVLFLPHRQVRGCEASKATCGDKRWPARRKERKREGRIKRTRKYRKGGYTVGINSRSRGDALPRSPLTSLRAQRVAVPQRGDTRCHAVPVWVSDCFSISQLTESEYRIIIVIGGYTEK